MMDDGAGRLRPVRPGPTDASLLGLRVFKSSEVLFCYLDEAGNFDFSPSGTPYFIHTALVTSDPVSLQIDLLRAKYRLMMNGMRFSDSHPDNDHFHATEDSHVTRSLVFGFIRDHAGEFRVYSVIVQKNKTNPSIREPKDFFSLVSGRLIREVIADEHVGGNYEHITVMTDKIPVQKKRSAVVSAIKSNVKGSLAGTGTTYSVRQMESRSDLGLQAADYASWAIYRKWTNEDDSWMFAIEESVRREVDYFYHGSTTYY